MGAKTDDSAMRGAGAADRAGQGELSPFSLVAAAVAMDLLLATLLCWSLARADGVALWPIREAVSGLCLFLPFIVVTGVWVSQGFSFRHAGSFASHLARTAAGGLAALLFALALYVGVWGEAVSQVAFIAGAALVLLCALHANYLGVVRSLARSGIVSLPLDATDA